jgi:hypothetical protein
VSSVLGIFLLCLWGFALGDPSVSVWLTWGDGLAALGAFMIAAFTPAFPTRSERMRGPLALSLTLFCFWILGLAASAAPWLAWWNLGFAVAFLVVGLLGIPESKGARFQSRISGEENEKVKRGA